MSATLDRFLAGRRVGDPRLTVIALAVMASLLTACGDNDAGTSTTSVATTTTTTVATTTTAIETTTSTSRAPVERMLALGADGLLLITVGTGSTVQFPFGTPQDDVMNVLRGLLGDPSEEGPGSPECPNGQDWAATWPDTLLVGFAGGDFLTWSLRPGSTLTDMAGIGLGSSVTDVNAAWDVTIQDTSLGVEFYTTVDGAGFGGVLSDSSGTAVVTNLWAGPACIFR